LLVEFVSNHTAPGHPVGKDSVVESAILLPKDRMKMAWKAKNHLVAMREADLQFGCSARLMTSKGVIDQVNLVVAAILAERTKDIGTVLKFPSPFLPLFSTHIFSAHICHPPT
jgi:hypothetical protein